MARSIGGGLAFASFLLVGCADAFAPLPPPVADGGFGQVDGALPSLDGAVDGAPAANPDGNGNPDGDAGGPVIPPGPDGGMAPVRDCASRFRYTPPGPVSSVALAGEFNQFSATATPMTGPDAQGAYSVSLSLAPGAYGYKLVVGDSDWRFDPSTPYTKYVGGVENSLREVGDCQLPRLDYVKLDRTPSTGALHAEVQYVSGAAASPLDPAHLTVLLDGAPAAGVTVAATGRISIDAIGLAKDKHRLVVRATDRDGRAAEDLHVPFWIEDQPFDFRDGLLYFAFTDRFRDGTPNDTFPAGVDARANYEGGDFAGIQQTIEDGYFDALGVRTLWISPPNANPDHAEPGTGNHLYTGYHGYWPSSGRETQKRFGDLAALQSLVKAAHHRGMRVIVDAVLNHVHADHPLYQQHKNDGWFNGDGSCTCGAPGCDWNTHALDCWFTSYLPDLNYQNFDAMKTMIDDALYWAREADVDGFRVDAVKHFLHAATRRLRAQLHDQFEHAQSLFYLVGETFDGDRGLINSYIGPNELHAQFDFPVYFALRDSLATYAQSLRSLEGATHDSDAAFGASPMSPFLGNHDVPRFLSTAVVTGAGALTNDPQGQAWSGPPGLPADEAAYFKLRLALTFVATQPGVPLVYYGDELGLPGAGDPDNRRFMRFSGYSAWEQSTIDHARKLGAARHELAALAHGTRQTLWIDDNLYVYARVAGNQVALVAINREWNARQVSVPIPAGLPLADGVVLRDRLGGPALTIAGGQLPLAIGAHVSALLAP